VTYAVVALAVVLLLTTAIIAGRRLRRSQGPAPQAVAPVVVALDQLGEQVDETVFPRQGRT
jgi:hypothetical protein